MISARFFVACFAMAGMLGHIAGVVIGAPGEYGDILLATSVATLLPVAVSLAKTHGIIRLMPQRPTTGCLLAVVAADAIITLALLLTLTWGMYRLFTARPAGLVEHSILLLREVLYPLPHDDTSGPEWVLFLAAGFTSVGIWLYAASHVLSRVVVRFPQACRRLDSLTLDLSAPQRRRGLVAVAIVLALLFGVAPVARLSALVGG